MLSKHKLAQNSKIVVRSCFYNSETLRVKPFLAGQTQGMNTATNLDVYQVKPSGLTVISGWELKSWATAN